MAYKAYNVGISPLALLAFPKALSYKEKNVDISSLAFPEACTERTLMLVLAH